MRIRVTRRRPGEVDGIELSSFQVGYIYDVSPSLATYLIMTRTAEPVVDEGAAPVVPVEEMAPATSSPRVSAATPESTIAADGRQPIEELN